MHLERVRKHGDPNINRRSESTPPIDRVMAKVVVKAPSGCWEFTGARQSRGHGLVRVGSRSDGSERLEKAHRVAYEALVGPVPDGLVLDHLCCNPPCVNPAHLEPVTLAENTRRGMAQRESCRNGHLYSEVGWHEWQDGRRMCAVCYRAIRERANQRRRERRREGGN